jgi:hypothetical protein|tara:strand:+ start:347 stop:673 length:327 start_codon:yes stop_codon:yes gene_type:complete
VTLEDASIQAVEEWSKLREVEKATGSPLGTLLSSCVSGWIQSQQVRHDSGELSASALQNKKGLFEGHVSRFIRFNVGPMSLTFLWMVGRIIGTGDGSADGNSPRQPNL